MNSEKVKIDLPYLFKGGVVADKRGRVSFVNDFQFPKIKRFYVVENRRVGMVRAWHGHKYESKFIFVVSGKALVGAVQIDNWKNPSKKAKVHSFLLSFDKPSILYIPKGYVNGFKSLTKDTKLLIFSTKTLDQSKKDDIRFDANQFHLP